MYRAALAVVCLTSIAACGAEPPAAEVPQGPSRADSVAMAMERFDAAAFDTIAWEAPSAAIERGGLVFRISCSKCHGEAGRGDGRFVMNGDTLHPPSFLAPEWRFANDPMGLRQQIYQGNVAGMPYWGLVGLKYRDIDAVARFVTEFLRVNYALR